MLNNLRTTATAIAATLSLAVALPAPAHAWGEREQNALVALLAAGAIGTLIVQNNKRHRAAPVTRSTVPTYTGPNYGTSRYGTPSYDTPRYQPPAAQPIPQGVSTTPAGRAFNTYSLSERRNIQSRLARAGYYNGAIDGAFGPMTYNAVMAISRDSTGADKLSTLGGAFDFYDAILRACEGKAGRRV